MSDYNLLPCPFCGSENVNYTPIEEQNYDDHLEGFIWCHGCGFTSDVFLDLKFAAEKWNTRAQLSRQKGELGLWNGST